MKAAWITAVAACWLFTALPARSQETPAAAPAASDPTGAAQEEHAPARKSEEGASPLWAWLNFAILAGILGYVMVKKGVPYFASRTQAIRQGILEAEEIRRNAEARAAEVDRMLAGLEAGIEGLRTSARKEQAAEADRIRRQSSADMARIQEHAAHEIDSASKAARMELKRYAAKLAVELAEQKIKQQMSPDVQAALVENFARNLELPAAPPHPNK
jgi:F-type H+-transporting ATPase subunit b